MKLLSRSDPYVYVQLFALFVPFYGYLIDLNYQTGYVGFIVGTLFGIILFIWGHIRHKKAKNKKEPRAIDWISKGCMLQIDGNHTEAIMDFTKACDLEPEAVLAYFARGRSYLELGHFEQAMKDFDRAVELNPGFVEAYDKRGLCYMKSGYHEEALKDFDMAIELNSKFAEGYINRGSVYEMLGNHELSIKDIQTAAKLGNVEAQNLLKSKGIEC